MISVKIRKANINEFEILTQIAFLAKKHWNYPEEYYKIWKDELTLTADYILKNIVWVAEMDNEVIGFYSIVNNPEDFFSGEVLVEKGFWLEHIFILPEFHKNGIGTALVKHAIEISKQNNIQRLLIFVDPFSEGFYKKMNATLKNLSLSSIKGREIPIYELKIN